MSNNKYLQVSRSFNEAQPPNPQRFDCACKTSPPKHSLRAALPDFESPTRVGFVGQHYILPTGAVSSRCIVTLDQARNLEAVYATVTDPFYGAAFGVPTAAWVKIDPTNGVRIGHNATDVFGQEPQPEEPLLKLDNVSLTAHASYNTPEAALTMYRRAMDLAAKG